MRWLSEKIEFPPHETATKEGVLALGGDLSPERLLFAYKNGIFPWYSLDEPIVWYSPQKRMVLFPQELKISNSMTKILKNHTFEITENEAFEEVIHQCKNIIRNDNLGTLDSFEILSNGTHCKQDICPHCTDDLATYKSKD